MQKNGTVFYSPYLLIGLIIMQLKTRFVSSLEKVFPDEELNCSELNSYSAMKGEIFSAQLAMQIDCGIRQDIDVKINAPDYLKIRLHIVRSVPVMMPADQTADDDFLRKTAGLYPDLLVPYTGFFPIVPKQWRSLWFEVEIPEDADAGECKIEFTLFNKEVGESKTLTFSLTVIDAVLPKQNIRYSCWVHYDCLATYYDVPVFSEEHWTIIENYIKHYVKYGGTTILTPLLTPPLDTEVGGERPTVQLVDAEYKNGEFIYDFAKFRKFVDISLECGITNFEIAPFFTQWGAKFAPKVIIKVDGEYVKMFGWDTPSDDPLYVKFLREIIEYVKEYMSAKKLLSNTFFRFSDEPSEENLPSYSAARESIKDLLEDCNTQDALAHYEFYKKGLVKFPVVPNDSIDEFIEKGFQHRSTYYCCGQLNKVSNRLIAMPSYRNRIIGIQFFKYNIEMFLQWGYNFWYSQLSKKHINPFCCTDSEDKFPAGDPFVVYPGENKNPLPSLREIVFFEALQDMRALQLLSQLTSFEETVEFIDNECHMNLTFKEYPRSAECLLDFRRKVNEKINTLL